MATLVTGGTGFVGSNIVKILAQRGHEVISYDVVEADALVRRYVDPWAERVTFVMGDILDREGLGGVAANHNITKIVHAAVFTAIRPDIEAERSRSIVDINVFGTVNLLDMACDLPLERFLYVSSGAVYGDNRDPHETLREEAVLYPRSLYAATKYTSEQLARRYGELKGVPTVSARLSLPYGPMERITGHRALMSVFHEWTGNVVRGEPIRVADRTLGRDYTYVADIAAGIATVLDARSLSYNVYNVSAGGWTTLEDGIKALTELRPSLQVVDDPDKEFAILPRGGSRGAIDVTRLREDLGFSAGYDLKAGLGDYLDWRESFGFLD